jgi:hypothetical protein
VPSDFVYRRLFGEDTNITDFSNLERIAEGAPLAKGTMLVRGQNTSDPVYLVDLGRRRLIATDAVFRRYGFAPERIFTVRQVLIDSIPLGSDWE